MPKGIKGFQRGELNPSTSVDGRQRIKAAAIARPPMTEKTKRKLSRSLQRVLRTPAMRAKWAAAQEGLTKNMKTRMKIAVGQRKGRAKKISSCRKYADSAFSKYIRLKHSDENGNTTCFTCGKVEILSEQDCGHYVSRIHYALRWDERNAHPQCKACNRFNEGRKDVYALKLIELYGPKILEDLQAEKHRVTHLSQDELLEIARVYKAKAKEESAKRFGISSGGYHPFIDKTLPVGDVVLEPD